MSCNLVSGAERGGWRSGAGVLPGHPEKGEEEPSSTWGRREVLLPEGPAGRGRLT